jgi:hypothetical protein
LHVKKDNKMKKQKFGIVLLLLSLALTFVSCSKWDDYKKYTSNGETSYTGRLDSAKIFSGRLRVKLRGILPADPAIATCKVTWNSGMDSMIFTVAKGPGSEVFERIIPVDEGIKNFVIQTFDAAGNPSVKSTASGTSYGPRYESGLTSRPILTRDLTPNGDAVITWDNFDTTTGVKGTFATYTTTSGSTETVFTSKEQSTTTLPNYMLGSKFSYRTAFVPDSTCIDTLYAPTVTIGVRSDITSLYLSNVGPNFLRDAFDGRFGTLAAPWVTNAAAKNKGGLYGGYSADGGGVICWETWFNTPVVDGIVYQPTSSPLPAGEYVVTFDEYSEIQANSSAYCVAAAGGSGIPNLANLSSALGFVALYNSAVIGTTGPSMADTRSFTFTLTTPQVVSIGFLVNLVGNGNPGNYFNVSKIRLLSN